MSRLNFTKLICRCYTYCIGNNGNVRNRVLMQCNINGVPLTPVGLQNIRSVWDSKTVKKKKQKGVKIPVNKIDKELEGQNNDPEFENIPPGSGTVILSMNSLRIDLALKSAFGFSRSAIDQAFYKSLIRVNGKKIFKKSFSLQIGDEADYIKGVSPDNPKHLLVSRIEILDLRKSSESLRVKVNRFKNHIVENYEEPWVEELTSVSDENTDNPPSIREVEELKP